MLGYEGKFVWKLVIDKGGLMVIVFCIFINKFKFRWVWVFKLEYVY